MDNRTIRRAIEKRVPEIYFIHAPVLTDGKVYFRMLANIDGKLYKMVADMPNTALVSHKELLNTMVTELYDEVKKIRSKQIEPPALPQEKDWTPMTDAEKRMLGINNMEDAMRDNPTGFLESATIPEVKLIKPQKPPKATIILH